MQESLIPISSCSSSSESYIRTESSNFHSLEDVGVIFNTAFVRSRAPAANRDLAAELAELSRNPAYQAIMAAAQQLAKAQDISELEAAEQIIATFKKMDEVWGAYLCQEGLARITS
jgi:hypothetical protein